MLREVGGTNDVTVSNRMKLVDPSSDVVSSQDPTPQYCEERSRPRMRCTGCITSYDCHEEFGGTSLYTGSKLEI